MDAKRNHLTNQCFGNKHIPTVAIGRGIKILLSWKNPLVLPPFISSRHAPPLTVGKNALLLPEKKKASSANSNVWTVAI